MPTRDRLSLGSWHSELVPGVVPMVDLSAAKAPIMDALADALATLLQIAPDVRIQKEGMRVAHCDLVLEPEGSCAACGCPLRTLRVLCGSCRGKPVCIRSGVSYMELCWQGSHPRLFARELWDRCAEAHRITAETEQVIQEALQVDADLVGVDGDFLLDDVKLMSLWRTLPGAIEAEVYPMAVTWLQTADVMMSGDDRTHHSDPHGGGRSQRVKEAIEGIALRVAQHAVGTRELTLEDAVQTTQEMVEEGRQAWQQACNEEITGLRSVLFVLNKGVEDERARAMLPQVAKAGLFPLSRMAADNNLRAIEQWRSDHGGSAAQRIRQQLVILTEQRDEPWNLPPSAVPGEGNCPQPAWLEAPLRFRLAVSTAPRLFPREVLRCARLLALVATILHHDALPFGCVRPDLLRRALVEVITRADRVLSECRTAAAPADLACVFLRGQALVERAGPLLEDEVMQAVACLRHFSMEQVATLVAREMGSLMRPLKDLVMARLPSVWRERGYREWLQHCLPQVLMHFNFSRSERASLRNPDWPDAELLWSLPKVRDFRPGDKELVLYPEDISLRASPLLKHMFENRRAVYKRRVGTRRAFCIAEHDVARLLSSGPFWEVRRG